MIWKGGAWSRLTLGVLSGLVLLGVQGASAGLVRTVDVLPNFQFENGQVDYEPDQVDLKTKPQWELDIEPRPGSRSSAGGRGEDAPYLSSDTTDDWESAVKEFGVASPSTSGDLLKESLESMRVDGREGRFDFLLKESTVPRDVAVRYAEAGVYTKAAGLSDSEWSALSKSLYDAATARAIASRSAGSPAIPVPGTLALLLGGAIGLAALRRRT